MTRARDRQKARNLAHAQLDMALAPPPARHDWEYGAPIRTRECDGSVTPEVLRCKHCGARMRFVTVSAGRHSVVQAEFLPRGATHWQTPRPPCIEGGK